MRIYTGHGLGRDEPEQREHQGQRESDDARRPKRVLSSVTPLIVLDSHHVHALHMV